MKLIRLTLDTNFRSLPKDFTIIFPDGNGNSRTPHFEPYCLAGRNGSGKSNVLQALASIFYHIECIYLNYRPDGFEYDPSTNEDGFRAEKAPIDAFSLEYMLPTPSDLQNSTKNLLPPETAHVLIEKSAGKRPRLFWLNRTDGNDGATTELARTEVKSLLPRYVLGYSSGHNEILSLPFFKMRFVHFDEYRDHLVRELPYAGRPEGRMIYVDEQFSQAILLCHFLFPSDVVTKVFEEKIGLKGIQRFRIIIRRHHLVPIVTREADVHDNPAASPTNDHIELTGKLRGHVNQSGELQLGLIDKLIKCATTYYEDTSGDEDSTESDLILDYWITDETRRAFEFHFGVVDGNSNEKSRAASALNLFQSLQTLLTLNYYRVDDQTKSELYRSDSLYLNETIPMPASHERIMRFKDFEIIKGGVATKMYGKALSDGEHQLVHTIGLCLLFRHESALFLLDEPETHLNPDWRASYVSTLRSALEADDEAKAVMREVIFTSHSPFIVSDCKRDHVLIFSRDPQGTVTWNTPSFNTFGASSNAITMQVFGQKETIGDYAAAKLQELRNQLSLDGNPDDLIESANELLGDSMEKILFINDALDKKGE
ncbi:MULTISPECIES: restriction system-associated AAA family ATPase [unclassified Burkholderia]|uniref:restriction system-associated AAA family ATPase n=1 Tax=unclassified Burkholderia TaxID=2613784 RepID=UPI0014228864|nr:MULTISPECIES: restriction system-associated AAA family ATPase [unclassified Burkholderia]NIE61263.1 restriction system-associated AAA family ATPase [Burkholderia sp. Ap-955]NIF13430.1 restriction system-associated AAA family ATPase [Burkholderia sp. Ax-1735]NIG06658.1 restriction system-associated AAA family ATPase [Burkholderia sp. Tr-849]